MLFRSDARVSFDRRRAGDDGGEAFHGGVLENSGKRDAASELPLDVGEVGGAEEGMSAEMEEVGIGAEGVAMKEAGADFGDAGFDAIGRGAEDHTSELQSLRHL